MFLTIISSATGATGATVAFARGGRLRRPALDRGKKLSR
jgi:hypothetical protein